MTDYHLFRSLVPICFAWFAILDGAWTRFFIP